jgi:extracellular factor (EF) 3-hydroxypalmitic acid methyl ester biosynthesis protein
MTTDPTHDLVRRAAHELLGELNRLEPLTNAGENDEALYRQLAQAFDDCLAQLRTTNLLGRANETPSSILWNIAGHILGRGWLQSRARAKPRGYPCDYEMLARFYERRLCDDPLGRLFDRYFQDQPAPRAVENRIRMVTDWIVAAANCNHADSLTVAIVGSAFGMEIRDALLRLDPAERKRVRITLLDLDPQALDIAAALLMPLLPSDNLFAQNINPLNLLRRPHLAAGLLLGSDLIFCPGVFDYLEGDDATAMLRTLYAQLAPGGRLTAFQFAPHDPTRAYMEWIGNWYLTYRDATTFRACVEQANLPSANLTFGAEPLGVDLFVTATAPSTLLPSSV